jgi:hypothetical protein
MAMTMLRNFLIVFLLGGWFEGKPLADGKGTRALLESQEASVAGQYLKTITRYYFM